MVFHSQPLNAGEEEFLQQIEYNRIHDLNYEYFPANNQFELANETFPSGLSDDLKNQSERMPLDGVNISSTTRDFEPLPDWLTNPNVSDLPYQERRIEDLIFWMGENKPYTFYRPSFRKGVVEQVWENAKGPDGLVRDPNTGDVINWKPGESRLGVWDMGHVPEQKYSEVHRRYMNNEMTKEEFLDWFNNPEHYRPELPSNNRGHEFE